MRKAVSVSASSSTLDELASAWQEARSTQQQEQELAKRIIGMVWRGIGDSSVFGEDRTDTAYRMAERLLAGVKKWNRSRGSFSTFAHRFIRSRLVDAIRSAKVAARHDALYSDVNLSISEDSGFDYRAVDLALACKGCTREVCIECRI